MRGRGDGRTTRLTSARFSPSSSRLSKPRIIPTSALSAPADKVPAALHLPHGKLFFGWTYKPFDPAGGSGTASSSSSAPAVRSLSPPSSPSLILHPLAQTHTLFSFSLFSSLSSPHPSQPSPPTELLYQDALLEPSLLLRRLPPPHPLLLLPQQLALLQQHPV